VPHRTRTLAGVKGRGTRLCPRYAIRTNPSRRRLLVPHRVLRLVDSPTRSDEGFFYTYSTRQPFLWKVLDAARPCAPADLEKTAVNGSRLGRLMPEQRTNLVRVHQEQRRELDARKPRSSGRRNIVRSGWVERCPQRD